MNLLCGNFPSSVRLLYAKSLLPRCRLGLHPDYSAPVLEITLTRVFVCDDPRRFANSADPVVDVRARLGHDLHGPVPDLKTEPLDQPLPLRCDDDVIAIVVMLHP